MALLPDTVPSQRSEMAFAPLSEFTRAADTPSLGQRVCANRCHVQTCGIPEAQYSTREPLPLELLVRAKKLPSFARSRSHEPNVPAFAAALAPNAMASPTMITLILSPAVIGPTHA